MRVALERYSKAHNAGCGAASPVGGAPTAKQVSALHEELSAVLDKELESALSIATGATPTERGSPGPMAERDGLAAAKGEEKGGSDSKVSSDLCHLLALAKENEQAGQLRRAEALHQVQPYSANICIFPVVNDDQLISDASIPVFLSQHSFLMFSTMSYLTPFVRNSD